MVKSLGTWFRWTAVLACVLIFILTTLEVLLRLLGFKFSLSYEYCGFLLGALVFFMLPAATAENGHIAVIKVDPVGGGWLTRIRHASIVVLTVAYFGGLIYLCGLTTLKSFQDGIRTQGVMLTPLYIPQTSMIIGLSVAVLLILVGLAQRWFGKGEAGGSGR
jgi:TRAP-type C4-dicarboxylate transport system permease small subunit